MEKPWKNHGKTMEHVGFSHENWWFNIIEAMENAGVNHPK